MSALFRTTATASKFARSFSSTPARATLNKIQLIGRVGSDPIVQNFDNDKSVTNYTVATSETRPDKEGNLVKRTQWHRVSVWNSPEWITERLKKGDLVYVEGRLNYSDYTDKEGVQRTRSEIKQSQLKILAQSNRNREAEGENEE
ncbi:hypothetical protein BDF14DRAFT_1739976 [Spinellus fusiger]|nr:hypothetical protein BDF14DRAFT_1739976 [Spinellus fusiger]